MTITTTYTKNLTVPGAEIERSRGAEIDNGIDLGW